MIFKAHSVKIPIVISNGRLSKKSFNRYKKLSFITTKTLKKISFIFAQSSNHKKRFHRLGVPLEKIKEVGSAKFDYDIYNNGIDVNNKDKQIILAASTHKKEDGLIIAAFKRLSLEMPEVELIIVPRHPERAKSIQNLLDREGMNSEVFKSIPNNKNKNKISIISATGILKELYPLASIAFIGGSLFKEYGGHNVIEAASQKCPFIVGPYTYNFEDVVLKFKENESCVQLDDNLDIFNAFKNLLSDNNLRDNMANKALDVCIKNTGSSDIQYNKILNIIREDKS